jgi:hypothetical protein
MSLDVGVLSKRIQPPADRLALYRSEPVLSRFTKLALLNELGRVNN